MINYAVGNQNVAVSFNPKEEMLSVVMLKNGNMIKQKTFAGMAALEEDFWDLFENFNEALDFESVVAFFKTKIKV